MDRWNTPTTAPRNRLHVVESLEDRWLLSGVQTMDSFAVESVPAGADVAELSLTSAQAIELQSNAVHGSTVEVIEFGVAADDDAELAIDAPTLPSEVVEAVAAQFPGAELTDAELSVEDGTNLYDVNAKWEGRIVGLTITADGAIVATEQTLDAGELPPPIRDWVRQNVPGAEIYEAERVTESGIVSYDLRIVAPGQQDLEATLRLQDDATAELANRSPFTGTDTSSGSSAVDATVEQFGSRLPAGVASPSEPLSSERTGISQLDDAANQAAVATGDWYEPPETPGADAAHTDQTNPTLEQSSGEGVERKGQSDTSGSTRTDDATTSVPNRQATPLVRMLAGLVKSVPLGGPTAWLPQVAGVLGDVLPIDVAAVELGLQQLLDEIDSLSDKVAGETAASTAALRIAVVAGLVTGAELVLLESRKPRRDPVLASSAANSSWSWVLGTATSNRP